MVFSGVGGDGRRDSSGVIVQWSAPPPAGEAVSEGDPLCEVETDKAEITMDCDQGAVVARILVSMKLFPWLWDQLFYCFPAVCGVSCVHTS